MNILVCCKAVPDPEQVIHVAEGRPEVVVDDGTELRMNHYDEFAIEEAVLIKETHPGASVTAITMGPEAARKTLKRAIGMGADNGIHILCDYPLSCDAAAVSACIAQIGRGRPAGGAPGPVAHGAQHLPQVGRLYMHEIATGL